MDGAPANGDDMECDGSLLQEIGEQSRAEAMMDRAVTDDEVFDHSVEERESTDMDQMIAEMMREQQEAHIAAEAMLNDAVFQAQSAEVAELYFDIAHNTGASDKPEYGHSKEGRVSVCGLCWI